MSSEPDSDAETPPLRLRQRKYHGGASVNLEESAELPLTWRVLVLDNKGDTAWTASYTNLMNAENAWQAQIEHMRTELGHRPLPAAEQPANQPSRLNAAKTPGVKEFWREIDRFEGTLAGARVYAYIEINNDSHYRVAVSSKNNFLVFMSEARAREVYDANVRLFQKRIEEERLAEEARVAAERAELDALVYSHNPLYGRF